jgi:hypothetical protein
MLGFSDALLSIIATVMVSVGPSQTHLDLWGILWSPSASGTSRPLSPRVPTTRNVSWILLSLFL